MVTTSKCLDCKSEAPKTESDYTLIRTGWRVTRRQALDGSLAFHWRCPDCWAKHRESPGFGSTASFKAVVPPSLDASPRSQREPVTRDTGQPSQRLGSDPNKPPKPLR